MRLLRRKGDDPRVIADLELLVAATAPGRDGAQDGAAAAAAAGADAADGADDVDGAAGAAGAAGAVGVEVALGDPFVRWFVRGVVHVRRYLPFYGLALVWLGVMVVADPVGERRSRAGEVAASGTDEVIALPRVGTTVPPPPPTAETGAAAAAAAEAYAESLAAGFGGGPSTGTTAAATAPPAPPSSPGAGTPAPRARRPLAIVRSGYSSRTGGTPLEQPPPGGGLPVAAAGGQATKRSFVALAGDDTTLRLALVDDPSNVGAEQAVVRACAVTTAGWPAARGSSFEDEPGWGEPCVTGVRGAGGVFTFDLSSFGAAERLPGFALTPGDASFHLTFAPAAAPAG